ncbi:hypothetical protein ACOMHN_032014 [Nucella lapillus]
MGVNGGPPLIPTMGVRGGHSPTMGVRGGTPPPPWESMVDTPPPWESGAEPPPPPPPPWESMVDPRCPRLWSGRQERPVGYRGCPVDNRSAIDHGSLCRHEALGHWSLHAEFSPRTLLGTRIDFAA